MELFTANAKKCLQLPWQEVILIGPVSITQCMIIYLIFLTNNVVSEPKDSTSPIPKPANGHGNGAVL